MRFLFAPAFKSVFTPRFAFPIPSLRIGSNTPL